MIHRPTPPIAFVHIPKAGGTTLRKAAEAVYHDRTLTVSPAPWDDQVAEVEARAAPDAHDFISGHFPVDLVDRLPFRTRIISVLREPAARIVSHYHYVQRSPEHWQHASAARMTLERYALSDLAVDLDNLQTRMLAGVEVGWHTPVNELPREALDLALDTLERRLWLAGVQEHLDAFIATLARRLGWPGDLEVKSYLVAPPRPPIDDRLARVIRERNWMDVELHARAGALFERCIGAEGGAEAA